MYLAPYQQYRPFRRPQFDGSYAIIVVPRRPAALVVRCIVPLVVHNTHSSPSTPSHTFLEPWVWLSPLAQSHTHLAYHFGAHREGFQSVRQARILHPRLSILLLTPTLFPSLRCIRCRHHHRPLHVCPPPHPATTSFRHHLRPHHRLSSLRPRCPHAAILLLPFSTHSIPATYRNIFSDLAFLFSRSYVASDAEQKYHATRFLALDDQELWESLPEFADHAVSFGEFTAAVFRLYPEADPDRRYSFTDLDTLVMEFSRTESPSRTAFLEFYRRFLVVSSFLISKGRLAAFEQSRALVHAIPPNIWRSVHARLCICCPDVQLDDTYPLESIRDAIDFILISSSTRPTSMSPSFPSAPVSLPIPVPAPCDPSLAALAEAVEKLAHLVLSSQLSTATSRLDSPPVPPHPTSRSSLSSLRPMLCSYCSNPAHFIARCPLVTKDIAAGLCKRNSEGKLVLPNGLFVPHRVVGPNLRTRIVSWHSVNVPVLSASVSSSPFDSRSQAVVAAPSLQSAVSCQPAPVSTAHHAPVPQSSDAVPPRAASSASIPIPVHVPTRPDPALNLSEHDRIAVLESQIAALRARRRDFRTAATPTPETRTTAVFLSQVVTLSPDPFQPPAPCSIDQQHFLDPPHHQPSPATSKIKPYAPSAPPRPTPHPPYRVSDSQATSTPPLAQSCDRNSCPGQSTIASAPTPSDSRSYAPAACPIVLSPASLRSIDPSPAHAPPVAASRVPDSPEQAPCTEPPVSAPMKMYEFPAPVQLSQHRPVLVQSHLPPPHSLSASYTELQSLRPAPLPSQLVPEDLAADFKFPADSVPTLRRSRSIPCRRSTPVHVVALA
ncbi:hypothetical protein GGX14DRAFT_557486 [Mycena pura]|uniref:Uncharacterized protein n=1 Tax=Mycena pura TaxID=153505 RepID=A0AAD6YNU3_9AGAR|nr:hypothetical protein GGX14DRAFT_557486 [Mycena pura]